MVKKILALLSLFICVGCSSDVKKVKVENFDYQKTKLIPYVIDTHNQQIEDVYNVANKHFEYVKNEIGHCSVFNKVSNSSDKEIYLSTNHGNGSLMNVGIYTKKGNTCSKIQSLDNINALSINEESYKGRVYINVISGEDEVNKSGLWVLDNKSKKVLSKFRTMASDFKIDRATGNLYTLEHLFDGSSYIREYNQTDQMINEYKVKDEEYAKLFIKNGEISFVSEKEVGKQSGDSTFNYVINVIPINNLFNDLQAREYKEVIEIEGRNSSFSTMKIVNDYVVFYGDSSIVCKLDYSKCNKYERDTIELFGGQGYIGINGGPKDDEGMYLNKFGTNEVEKLLTYAQTYLTRQDGKNIYFQVFNRDDESKMKTIKYTLK